MERKNEDFLKNNYDVSGAFIKGEGRSLAPGGGSYDRMKKIMNQNDITNDSILEEVGRFMDFQSYIDYWIYDIYTGKRDNQNTRYWRPDSTGGKWRWLTFDLDRMSGTGDSILFRLTRYEPSWGVLFPGRLLMNEKFRGMFLNRFADYLNTEMQPENVAAIIDKIATPWLPELARDSAKWGRVTPKCFAKRVRSLKSYASKKREVLWRHLQSRFEIDGLAEVTLNVEPPGSGQIKINTIQINSFPWTGQYFRGIPVTVTAVANEGYEFVGWGKKGQGDSNVFELNLSSTSFSINGFFKRK
jgi:hypothetical protein